jgi:hypothetical protein
MKNNTIFLLSVIMYVFQTHVVWAQCPLAPTCTQTAVSGTNYTVAAGTVLCITSNYSSGTLTLTGGTVFIQSGGTLSSGANVSFTTGIIQVASGGTLSKDMAPSTSGIINNCGTITGNPSYNSNMTFNNYSTSTLTFDYGKSTVNNYASNDSITYLAIDNGINFNNINSTNVILVVNNGNPNSAVNITNSNGSSVTVITNPGNSNCSQSLGNSTNITNNGTMIFPNSLCIKGGAINNSGNITFSNQLAMNGGTVATLSGGTTSINVLNKNAGNLNVYDGSTMPITTIQNFSSPSVTMMNTGCSYITLATPPSVSFNTNFINNGTNAAPAGINYCGGVPKNSAAATNTIASVTNNGSGLYEITFASSSNTPSNNGYIDITGVTGGSLNGYWQVTKISSTVYDLIGSTYSTISSLVGNVVYVNNLYFGNGNYLGPSGCANPCIALPVKLVSFNAVSTNGVVQVQWQTSQEINNNYFIVEKSTDGIHFELVGEVKGNQNSTTLFSYSLQDAHALSGTSYYRLKQVDINGSYTYSSIVVVNIADTTNEWTIYPNPTSTGSFTIASDYSDAEIIAVVVTDVTGNRIRNYSNGAYQQEMLVSDLSEGLYIVSIQTSAGLLSKKVIVR